MESTIVVSSGLNVDFFLKRIKKNKEEEREKRDSIFPYVNSVDVHLYLYILRYPKRGKLDVREEATRSCERRDGYDCLVVGDKLSAMCPFFNTSPQVKRRKDIELGP